MKKNLHLILLLSFKIIVNAQTGLDSIIVETYYVSDINDSIGSSGILPVGSITYRFYADMDSGYNFQMAYGSPTHLLKFTTTKSFYNNTDYGSVHPAFTSGNAKKNTVMLDSWLTIGAACFGYWGILKSEDDGSDNFVNRNNLLANNNPLAGIPLTQSDGMLAGTVPAASIIGTFNTDAFNDGSVSGDSLGIDNGAWYLLGGVTGPTDSNRVLIAQVTTNGILNYELNVLLGKDLGGGESLSEKYVANNPLNDEISGSKYYLSGTLIPPSTGPGVTIKDLKSSGNLFKVFPNPAGDFVNLEIAPSQPLLNTDYKVINMNGQVILTKYLGTVPYSVIEKIPLSGFSKGIYTVIITADDETVVRRIIKE